VTKRRSNASHRSEGARQNEFRQGNWSKLDALVAAAERVGIYLLLTFAYTFCLSSFVVRPIVRRHS
jgi:hypothetical protein